MPSFDIPAYSIHVDNGVHTSCPGTHQEIFDHMFALPNDDVSDDERSLFSNVDDTEKTGSPQGDIAV